jgi:hypothetical protein
MSVPISSMLCWCSGRTSPLQSISSTSRARLLSSALPARMSWYSSSTPMVKSPGMAYSLACALPDATARVVASSVSTMGVTWLPERRTARPSSPQLNRRSRRGRVDEGSAATSGPIRAPHLDTSGSEREEEWDHDGCRGQQQQVQRCAYTQVIAEPVPAGTVDEGVGLVAHGGHEAVGGREHDRDDEREG